MEPEKLTETPLTTQAPRKRHLGRWAFVILVLIVLLSLGTYAIYKFFPGLKGTNTASPSLTVLGQVPGPAQLGPTFLQVTNLAADNSSLGIARASILTISGDLTVTGNGVFSGRVQAATLLGDGSGITNVNAALLDGQPGSFYQDLGNLQGAISDSKLSSNVALRNSPNTFTAANTFTAPAAFGVMSASSASMTTITLGQALTVSNGGTGLTNVANQGVLFGQGTNALGVAVPGGAGQCLLSTASSVQWGSCAGGSVVASLNGATGALTLANATAAGSTIIIDDASTSAKGIASFNTANFSVTSGAVNTIQNIATSSTPTFAGLTLGGPLAVASGGTGANSLAANGVIVGQGTGALTAVTAGGSGLCLMSTAGTPSFQACPGGGGGVASVNGLTGALTIANATAAGSVITLNDASTSQKGIAQFDATNFTTSSGLINTIQNINATAAPTFGQLTLTSSQAANAMISVNNTNAGATGNLIDLQLNGSSKFSVTPAGNVTAAGAITSGTINGQTISSTANFTGSLAVGTTLNVNTITPTGALTIGATGQSFALQGNASSTIAATNAGNSTTLSFQSPTANVNYRLLTAAAGTYDICTTAGNCSGVGGGVTTPGGTTNTLAKFTAGQTIGDSSITDNGTTVTIGGVLAVNTITPSAALTIGSTGQNLTLQGAAVGLTSTSGGTTNTLTFATPSGAGKTITIPNAAGTVAVSASGPITVDANGNIACATCVTSGGGGGGTAAVDSLDGLTGTLTIANSSGAGATITLNDASTSQKGIAQFNSTNFSAASGTINTIQNINITAAPTFGQLTLTSSQATNPMLVINNTNIGASGNLVDLQLNGSSKFAVSPAGSVTLSGTLTVASAANLNGGATVTGTLTANTITPSASLTVGAASQSFTLQGNASSTITATNGANTTSLSFQSPTASVTYRFLAAAAGTYDICTTVGNCSGVGGGVTTSGGTTNKVAKFTGSQSLGDSIITDNGATVTIGGTLAVNTITPSSAMTVGVTGQNLTLQGAVVSLTSTSGGITNSLAFATPSGSNKTITIPNATGTVAVSASGPLALDASGNLTCPTCATTGSGVTSLNSLTGALALANASGAGSTITINDASTSQKGIAQFNNTNFTASSGTINTVQNINITAAPTFGQLTLTSSQASASMLTINNTNAGASGNLIDLQLNGTSKFSVSPAGNVIAAGTVNGQTISSAANFTGTLAVASTVTAGGLAVNGTATVKVDSATAFQVQNSSSQSLLTVDTSGNTIALLGNNSSALSTWTTTSALTAGASTPRVRGGSIAANGYIYQLGGVDGTGATVATTQYAKQNADGTLGSWTATTSLPTTIRQFQPVVANGYIYVIGGRDNSNTALSSTYYAKLNADGSIGIWNTGLPIPSVRFGSGTVYYNGYMYVIGGFNNSAAAQSTVYSAKVNADGTLDSGSWTTNTALSSVTSNVNGAIVANGYLYLVGGFVGSSDTDTITYSKISSTGTLGSWTTTSAGTILGGGDENFETYVANGYLYAVGGDAGSRVTAFPLNANGSVGTAQPLTTFPGGQVGEAGMAQANGYFYVIGGSGGTDGSGTVRSSVYYANTPKVKIGGGLDLTSYSGETQTEGNTGGTLTAGNTNIVGSLNVQDKATFAQSVTMNDTLSVAGTAAFLNDTRFDGSLVVSNPSTSPRYTIRVDATEGTLKLGTNAIGYSSNGSGTETGDNNIVAASKYNSGSGGTLSSLYIYTPFVQASPSNHVKVAIYADNAGVPGSLVSSASAPSTVATAGWNTVSLGGTVNLAANTNYWLAFNVDGSTTTIGYGTGGTTSYLASTYSSNFPSNFGVPSSGNVNFSIYGTYTSLADPSKSAGAISINANNEVIVKPRSDTAAAFQVQNTSGSSVFNVDTTNSNVTTSRMSIGTGYSSAYQLFVLSNAAIIPFGAYRTTTTTTDTLFELFSDVGGSFNNKFRVTANGNVFTDGSTTMGTPADVAENYETVEAVEPGDVVAFTNDMKLEKTTTSYGSKLAGVVSTNPGVILSGNTNGAPLALKGHVPVKVSAENGAIHPGDHLTASATKPGYAMKATGAGMTLGTALNSLESGTGTIELFVNLGYSNPSQDLQGSTFGDINVTGTLTAKNLVVTNNLTTAQLTVNGHIISSGGAPTVTVGGGACTGTTASISGTDTAGLITLTTGSDCNATGNLATLTFNKPFGATPRVTLTPASADAASVKSYIDSDAATADKFSIATQTTSLSGSAVYKWYYQVIQ